MAIAGTAAAAADEENRSASVAKTATPQPDTAAKRTKLAEARQLRPKNAAAAVAETPDLGAPTYNKYVNLRGTICPTKRLATAWLPTWRRAASRMPDRPEPSDRSGTSQDDSGRSISQKTLDKTDVHC